MTLGWDEWGWKSDDSVLIQHDKNILIENILGIFLLSWQYGFRLFLTICYELSRACYEATPPLRRRYALLRIQLKIIQRSALNPNGRASLLFYTQQYLTQNK